jgi:putative aldouronate transport system permease protein
MKLTKGRKVFITFNTIAIIILSIIFVYPYLLIFMSSFTKEITLLKNGYSILPDKYSFNAYVFIFSNNFPVLRSLLNSVVITVISVFTTTTTCLLYSYALQHKKLKGKKFFNVYVVITMLFGGGLVPYYLVVSSMFYDSIFSLIIPSAMAAWYTFLIRSYFLTIPISISEAAEIDGAGHFKILFSIYVPLSMPVIATIALFVAVAQWNNYVGPMLFIDSIEKYPIQLTLQKILDNVENMVPSGGNLVIPTESVKMASVVVATLPIIIVYPFLQKYFISGMILGGVKE